MTAGTRFFVLGLLVASLAASCGRSAFDPGGTDGRVDTGIDRDGTGGDADCGDGGCIEICDDGDDNDGDGLTDCDDGDCLDDPACAVANCPDEDLGSAVGPAVATGTTFGRSDLAGSCGGEGAADHALSWTAPGDGTVSFDTFGSSYDTLLYALAGSCAGSSIACNDDTRGVESRIEFDVREGDTFVIVVDGFGSDEGEWRLNAGFTPAADEICDDGRDNDGDGAIDCEDDDCFDAFGCFGEDCANGVDDDGDGAVDCEDDDCAEACGDAEVCFDGFDNDGDGAIDCEDPDCADDPACSGLFEDCFNGIDDDGDGAVDCEDRDCADVPGCSDTCFFESIGDATGPGVWLGLVDPDAADLHTGSCFGGGFPEAVVEWVPPADGEWLISTELSPVPTALHARIEDCFGPELACTPFGDTPRMLLDVPAGVPVYLFVEIPPDTPGLPVQLSIGRPESGDRCANGEDDDFDGAIDCDDADCSGSPACGGEPEICDDGVDNDGDDFIDCDDLDCAREPFCDDVREICDDGDDNDGDGFVDCEDEDCADTPDCAPAFERCDDGIDNDGDGFVDCDDADCAGTEACVATCPEEALGRTTGDPILEGSTRDGANAFAGSCGGSESPERSFAWTAPETGRYAAFVPDAAGFDPVLYVRSGACEGDEVACNDDDGGVLPRVEFDAVRGEPFVIFVDGFGERSGEFLLSITPVVAATEAGLCDNGVDDDRDGRADCDDPDCRDDDACVVLPEICDNGVDDDRDGTIDCDDPDCGADPICRPVEICDNRRDDDRDGRTDCADPDCADDPDCVLPVELCDNGIDDDGDGDVDCRDANCRLEPVCLPDEICDNGRDDDRDRRIDCDDPDCIGAPGCATTDEVCDNGRDDDGDGAIDCDDTDCEDADICVPGGEICNDGLDNDGDGAVDCDDPECVGVPVCLAEPEVCDDAVDNDRNGLTDCDDPACRFFPACRGEEICDNGIDDDRDGFADCDDFDCVDDPECAPAVCPGGDLPPGPIAIDGTVEGESAFAGSCGGGRAAEATWAWTAPEAGVWSISTEGSTYDTLLYVRDGSCEGAELACVDDSPPLGLQSRVVVPLEAGQTIIVFVDGFGTRTGDYVLTIEPAEVESEAGLCRDGADNDGDGAVDCDDTDCADDPACLPLVEICTNRIDDDRDGRVDCLDEDCAGDPACADREVCDNGVDDDGDGRVDCEDPECVRSPLCVAAEICDNGFDDDRDGAVDCDDTDCAALPACDRPEICDNGVDDDADGRIDCADVECFTVPACLRTEICDNGIDDDDDGLIDCEDIGCIANPACARGEICDNGVDDDGDGATDCADAECVIQPVCRTENCSNGIDDDDDGDIDCEDLNCIRTPECALAEVCDDGVDNDRDGAVDCDDTECASNPACVGPICPNGDLGGLIGAGVATGSTTGATDDTTGSCASNRAEDVAFTWTAPTSGRYRVTTQGSTYDTLLYVLDGDSCEGDEVACNDDTAGLGLRSAVTIDAVRGQTFTLVVDGFGASSGDFVLNITRAATTEAGACADGRDNDADGAVDCADTDCALDPACVEAEVCDDGEDNDGDGDVDCDDTDCLDAPDCVPTPELCDDGIDNDRDGDVDCTDVDCIDDPVCAPDPEICDDGVDNDGDGDVDCDDADCAADPSCVPDPEICDDGIDNDGDGDIDCDDADCADLDVCAPTPEVCDDGVDNDRDGDVDCEDADCDDAPTCVASCPTGNIGSRVGDAVIEGSTVGLPGGFAGTCQGASAPEVSYVWRAPAAGTWRIDTAGSGYDTVLYARRASCGGVELACNDDTAGLGRASQIDVVARFPNDPFLIFIDGFGSASGDYVLNIRRIFESETGLCDDGVDNDEDGTTDCDDTDCAEDDACALTCPNEDLGSRLGERLLTGSTVDAGSDNAGTCGRSGESPEVTATWTAPRNGRYAFDTVGSSYDTVLYVRRGTCGDEQVACNDDTAGLGLRSEVVFTARGGDTFTFYVDGFGGRSGDFVLNGALLPTTEAGACDDTEDNDRDGDTDCDDLDCFTDPICGAEPEVCDNGLDDDGDGDTDCDDADCVDAPACIPDEVCDNRIDDDRDGDTDCADADCADAPACIPDEVCDNGIDDDRDGDTDCDDPDCVDFFACVPDEVCDNGIDDDRDGDTDCDDFDCRDAAACIPPEVCDNGIDDDRDGRTDCADVDSCAGDPACDVDENCANDVDDDADGRVDCNDSECFTDPACFLDENCTNGRDDDGDGLVDCADPSCSVNPACFGSENCGNGRDDDGDGLVDCADPSCALDAACRALEDCDNGIDDDGNGDVDCDDVVCLIDPVCLGFPFPFP